MPDQEAALARVFTQWRLFPGLPLISAALPSYSICAFSANYSFSLSFQACPWSVLPGPYKRPCFSAMYSFPLLYFWADTSFMQSMQGLASFRCRLRETPLSMWTSCQCCKLLLQQRRCGAIAVSNLAKDLSHHATCAISFNNEPK